VYADTGAVHGLVAVGDGESDLHQLLSSLSRAQAAGLDVYWRLSGRATPRQIALVVFLAQITAASAVLISGDQGDMGPVLVMRLLAEAEALR